MALANPNCYTFYKEGRVSVTNIARRFGLGEAAILAGIVLLYLATAWLLAQKLGLFTNDPDYQYLLNGLNILELKAPRHFDHPGTPVQLLVAIITAFTWLLTSARQGLSNLPDDVLARPQFYMSCISAVFTVGVAASMAFFLWSMRKASGTMMPALFALATIIPSYIVYQTFHRVMPEPLLFCATMFLAGLLAQVAFAPKDQPTTPSLAIWTGILLGFCVTAKVTSIPVLLIILALRSNKARMTSLVATGMSALVFLFPVWSLWRPLLRNYFQIATHKGAYGAGAAGIPTLTEIWGNIGVLAGTVPAIFVCPIVYISVLLISRLLHRPLPAGFARVLLVCTLIAVVAVMLVAKQPHPYYLISVLPFICLGNALVLFYVCEEMRIPKWVALVLTVPLAFWAYLIFSTHADLTSSDASADQRLMEIARGNGCLVVPYYGIQEPQFNLFFGNVSTGERYSDRLSRMYPDFLAYNTALKSFQTFQDVLSLDAAQKRLASRPCVYLVGVPWDGHSGIPATSLRLVARSKGGINLYALASDWDTSAYGKR